MDHTGNDRCSSQHQKTGEQTQTLPIPTTDSERIEFQKAAERCGLSLADWIRDRLLQAAKREAKEA
jgi:hypothetical protein